jgi:p-aminobenzoyl-glutamate transporter AbgT
LIGFKAVVTIPVFVGYWITINIIIRQLSSRSRSRSQIKKNKRATTRVPNQKEAVRASIKRLENDSLWGPVIIKK